MLRSVTVCLLSQVSGTCSSFIFNGYKLQSLNMWSTGCLDTLGYNHPETERMSLNKDFSIAQLRKTENRQECCVRDRELGMLDSKVTCLFSFMKRAYFINCTSEHCGVKYLWLHHLSQLTTWVSALCMSSSCWQLSGAVMSGTVWQGCPTEAP
jgi:hypothetical protein